MAVTSAPRPPAAPAPPGYARRPIESHPLAAQMAAHRRRDGAATAALAVVGVLGGVVTGLALREVWPIGGGAAAVARSLSVLAAVVGTYGVLLLLVLIARLPVLERAIGQDRLVAAHKRIAPWATGLVALHVVLVLVGYAGLAGTGVPAELWTLLTTTAWMLPAAAGFALMVTAALTSWRRVRRRVRYQTWWTIHLYTYLAVALAFAHQVTAGGPFLDGWARALWAALYAVVFGAIAWFRVLVPLWRSWRHQLRVEEVVRETPDVVSVVVRGRDLERLGVQPGQFLYWRFAHSGLFFEGHPYSVSGLPRGNRLRVTVKGLGDASAAVAGLPAGTRAFVEGPYGAVTPGRVLGSRAVLVAGGVGIAQVRALAEGLAGRMPVDVLYRASAPSELALVGELRALGGLPGVRLHLLPGPRTTDPLSAAHLSALVGDVRDADVFVCGPDSLNRRVVASARALGVRPERIHHEMFNL